MRSMTGYGEAADENSRHRMSVRIRSVNHRSLDLSVRLPEACRREAEGIRQRVGEALHRGRVELSVDCRFLGDAEVEVHVQSAAVERLAAVVAGWQTRGWTASGLTAGEVFRLPGVVELESREEGWDDDDRDLLRRLVDEALEELVAARRREGAALRPAVESRLQILESVQRHLEERRGRIVERLADDLRQRLEALLADVEIDPQRLIQEAAILADRSDVREELDRLAAHLERFRQVAEERGPVGKRLDFFAQEISRELNTIGAKARDAALAHTVVAGKSACEQIREQLQNVE